MGRNLIIVRLGAVTVLICAAMASAASAAPKLTSASGEYPLGVAGSQSSVHVFTLPGTRTFKCTTLKFEGSVASKAEAETSAIVVAPAVSEGCTAEILGSVVPITVELNGCEQKLSLTEAASGKPKEEGYEYKGQTTLQCPEAQKMEIKVWQSEAKHVNNEATLCTYTIAAQGPISSVDYKLESAGTEGTMVETSSGISVTRTSGTLANCGAASQSATYEGKTHFEAFNSKFEMVKMSFDP